MKVWGITGGMGSGKTMVSKLLETMGVPVYNTDVEAKKITESSPVIQKKLSDKFGSALYSGGKLNRTMLASLIFNHSEHLAFVNSTVHPEVYKDFLEWKKQHSEKEFTGIESAILFESGFARWVDVRINVSAPLETRIQRIQKRDRLSREAVLTRINNQLSDEEKNRLADYTIINDDVQALLPQIENLFKLLKFQ
jgi:dephospho-CoA kinase